MKMTAIAVLAGVLAAFSAASVSAATTDTVQAPTGFFVPDTSSTYDTPYYRSYNEDWGWTQSAISGTITSATLNISAFDVDEGQGEIDNIYVMKNGAWTLLGHLQGASDIYSFTEFSLDSSYFADIAAGLQITMDIDVNVAGWAVTLAKSSLSIDGGSLPPPTPSPAPEPASLALMLAGIGLVGFAARRRRAN